MFLQISSANIQITVFSYIICLLKCWMKVYRTNYVSIYCRVFLEQIIVKIMVNILFVNGTSEFPLFLKDITFLC